MQATFTIFGSVLDSDWMEIIANDGPSPMIYTEVTGPEEAFQVKTHRGRDFVRIVRADDVTANTYWCAV